MKVTRKDYVSCKVSTSPATMRDICSRYMLDLPFVAFVTLSGDRRGTFKKLWGKPDWHFRTNHDLHVWVREFDGITILAMTGAVFGTIYKVVLDTEEDCRFSDEKAEKVVAFWKGLKAELDALAAGDASEV